MNRILIWDNVQRFKEVSATWNEKAIQYYNEYYQGNMSSKNDNLTTKYKGMQFCDLADKESKNPSFEETQLKENSMKK